jgi:enoyl-[acyl-carrier protein] reductase II
MRRIALRTRLTDLLDVEHPVMLAGMGGVSYAPLVAAVAAGGGFGCLGASTMPAEMLSSEMVAVRAATERPFGVDLLTVMGDDLLDRVRLLVDGGASLFVAGLGVPTDAIDLCHRHGVLVANMCGKVGHAVRAVASGCDLVIAQGTEAGGHTGQVATMPLVPQIVDAVGDRVPVVAAGGIYDGRGLAAALALGADGVWVGTRFIATPEARGVTGYKDALLAAAEDETVVTRAYSGKPMRVLRNQFTEGFAARPDELQPFPLQIRTSVGAGAWHLGGDESTPGIDLAKEGFPAGQGVGGIHELVPAADLVGRFVTEADLTLRHLHGLLAHERS